MDQDQKESNDWIISISSLELKNKRKAINACEQIINRNGKLINYKKQKATQLKFTCELAIENLSAFFMELQKQFSLESHQLHEYKNIADGKKPLDKQVLIIILTVEN